MVHVDAQLATTVNTREIHQKSSFRARQSTLTCRIWFILSGYVQDMCSIDSKSFKPIRQFFLTKNLVFQLRGEVGQPNGRCPISILGGVSSSDLGSSRCRKKTGRFSLELRFHSFLFQKSGMCLQLMKKIANHFSNLSETRNPFLCKKITKFPGQVCTHQPQERELLPFPSRRPFFSL